ncbi:VOC family protein [Terribacillus saccharophilus]|uniref:Glyoxalase n=1 Tax=Terribacillus saccharophilus TaxID=361277 RepID=A0A268A801_9BACI|nr:VOC family protein [Terribacillus saccharophilus]PAD20247.1 glyoxalase [Terribacillus saccharophilus]PAF18312.1 glyoxalase [Terribacillus saccharophilus]
MEFFLKRFDHVQLACPKGSEEQAREFFVGIFGFEEIEKPANLQARGGVWFSCNDIIVHMGVEEPFSPARKAHPAFEVEGLLSLRRYLDKHDVDFSDDADLPGADRIYVNDPFGNRLEFLEWH